MWNMQAIHIDEWLNQLNTLIRNPMKQTHNARFLIPPDKVSRKRKKTYGGLERNGFAELSCQGCMFFFCFAFFCQQNLVVPDLIAINISWRPPSQARSNKAALKTTKERKWGSRRYSNVNAK